MTAKGEEAGIINRFQASTSPLINVLANLKQIFAIDVQNPVAIEKSGRAQHRLDRCVFLVWGHSGSKITLPGVKPPIRPIA
ncbi:hypothetical protein [Bradyrhizobium yuanmingense]|uniref:hypothetical protein n=1 Tax=Bradyrhizobium yuanmingense TaxID=108015 RepID=UPI0023B8AA78|nr:hypothetical protein [Bradyrhizobium yuanmingense]MDF0583795.1 hypothetical protein [Bradyrhizobium yuanmingense]